VSAFSSPEQLSSLSPSLAWLLALVADHHKPALHASGCRCGCSLIRSSSLLCIVRLDALASVDLSPANQTPVLIHAARQRNLLPNLRAHGNRELGLGANPAQLQRILTSSPTGDACQFSLPCVHTETERSTLARVEGLGSRV
jgi:hypothetical protein